MEVLLLEKIVLSVRLNTTRKIYCNKTKTKLEQYITCQQCVLLLVNVDLKSTREILKREYTNFHYSGKLNSIVIHNYDTVIVYLLKFPVDKIIHSVNPHMKLLIFVPHHHQQISDFICYHHLLPIQKYFLLERISPVARRKKLPF